MTPEPACRPTKTCTACGETKPLTDFHRDKNSRDGRRGDCATCVGIKNKKRNAQPYEPTAGAGCHYAGCRRTARHDGLCDRHHAYLAACRESPLALTGGRWVPGKGGVRRWVA